MPDSTSSQPFGTPARLCGLIKVTPEDFVVEELPAYLPSGDGEHLFLWIEKRDVSSDFLLGMLSRALQIRRDDIGLAGQKDRRAVTRQWISVPASCEPRLDALKEYAGQGLFSVLESARHRNKLRTGHLAGNRFSILIRSEQSDAYALAQQRAEVIRQHGVANRYGDQRFGIGGETLQLGLDLLRGRQSPRNIDARRRKYLLRLALSAVQSDLFNRVVEARQLHGTLRRVLAGDILEVIASGGVFHSEDPFTEQQRVDARDLVPTGPLFGVKMRQPSAVVLQLESTVLMESDLSMELFQSFRSLMSGTRRALVVDPEGLAVHPDASGVRIEFSLPPGSYATTVLGEFLQHGPGQEEVDGL